LGVVLGSIPPDGGLPRGFSEKSEVDAVMKEGEAAFARGDFTRALAAYAHALELDPRQYEAALFTGDVYFKQNQMEKAGEWFARAVEIDENRETAHRYWGDALLRSGNTAGARTKFIDAVIAEPYNRNAWVGLSQWAQTNRITLAHPRVDVPPPAQAIGLWAAYSKTRTEWVSGAKFAEAFPQENRYRHSLAEEAEALRMVGEAAATQIKQGTLTAAQLDASVGNLVRLIDAGLLESYVLLARADEGIARDYPAYRQSYRDKLKQYLSDYVLAARR